MAFLNRKNRQMKSIYTFAFSAFLLFATSCDTKPAFDTALFEGAWKCAVMVTDGTEDLNPQNIVFDFKKDSTYSYTGGSYTEAGKWYLEGNKLVTIANDDLEKKVEIEKINADTLIMNMNDRGTEVQLILLAQ